MKKSMDEMNLRFSKMEESINFCDERQKDLEKRLVSLEKRSASCNNFSEQVLTLEQKIASMEQQARDCNIEITNVPERRGESLVQLVVKLGTMVNQPVTTKDIVAAHRVPHADAKDYRPKNIIVKFATKILRDNFLYSCRSKKSITTIMGSSSFSALGLPKLYSVDRAVDGLAFLVVIYDTSSRQFIGVSVLSPALGSLLTHNGHVHEVNQ
ncbi:unnamed protein product [Leptidea sinapis]|uniref:Uncharacterized protein n=1 Tax=Leptidea sinapis TaxID=189913 RepID=A0A5E4QVF1_9NEOP|nr:unnamed protein product [Leptidea sinapis]